MGKIDAETCSICKENPSKYRCPWCSAPYCSLACNQAHKAGSGGDNPTLPCPGRRVGAPLSAPNDSSSSSSSSSKNSRRSIAGAKRPREEDSNGNGGIVEEDRATASGSTTACVRKGRDQWRGGKEDKEEEEWQMSADQMKRMSGCAWLKSAVRDPKLQMLLTEIDRADDRERALAFHRTSTQFGEFMDKVLLEIEEYRRGGADEPELIAADP